MNIILLGPPGSGKGTQAENIYKSLLLTHLSTGEMLRNEVAKGTPLGMKAKSLMDAGKLVDDQTILGMIGTVLAENTQGVLFDGFPRTVAQAQGLESIAPIDMVVELTVADAEVVRRICGRRIVKTPDGKEIPFTNLQSAQNHVKTNGGVVMPQRADDNETTVKKRLEAYHAQTAPVAAYYRGKRLLYVVNGSQPIDNVWHDVQSIIMPLKKTLTEHPSNRNM